MNFKTATSLGLAGASLALLGSSVTANADDISNDIQPETNQTQSEQSTQTAQVHQPKQVTVQSGDSLWKISQENNTTVNDLIRLNDIQGDGSLIHVGEVIKVSSKSQMVKHPKTNNPLKMTKTIHLFKASKMKHLKQIASNKSALNQIYKQMRVLLKS